MFCNCEDNVKHSQCLHTCTLGNIPVVNDLYERFDSMRLQNDSHLQPYAEKSRRNWICRENMRIRNNTSIVWVCMRKNMLSISASTFVPVLQMQKRCSSVPSRNYDFKCLFCTGSRSRRAICDHELSVQNLTRKGEDEGKIFAEKTIMKMKMY